MSNERERGSESGLMTLLGGVITDTHRLITQQLALFRHEIQGDFSRARAAASLMAAGLVFFTVGSVTLCGMLALLVTRIVPEIPLWAGCGLVGVPVSVLGAALCLVGVQRLNDADAVVEFPERETGENIHG